MTSDSPADVVEHYLDAISRRDDDTLRRCLADTGFHYESPIASFDDPDAFIQYVSVTGGILQRIERRHRFVDNHDVCHWLVFVTQLSERVSTPAVQWARVEDGRIVSIELLFDPHRYRQLFDVDGGNREDASAGPALIVATVSSPDRSGPGGRCASAAPQTDAVATEPTPLTETTGPRRAT